jgi:hypothetical protein
MKTSSDKLSLLPVGVGNYDLVKLLVDLVVDQRLEFLRVGDIEIKKAIHQPRAEELPKQQTEVESDDDVLFLSGAKHIETRV